ncbi:MAG: hypothetical protein JRF69_00135 [Deltaproteobacteria bacterium]|nr:hypothetical protein [Deltaproteobacteria bacterium]
MWSAILVLLFSFPKAVVVSASEVGKITLSYDIIEKDTADTGHTLTLTVHLKIKNIGGSAIDNVTAHVAGTEGMAVGLDNIFFGLIENGQTLTSEQFDLVVETGNSQDVQPGIVWEVEYWTRYGTGVVEQVSTPFGQSSCKPLR